jgi:hypothetical protein
MGSRPAAREAFRPATAQAVDCFCFLVRDFLVFVSWAPAAAASGYRFIERMPSIACVIRLVRLFKRIACAAPSCPWPAWVPLVLVGNLILLWLRTRGALVPSLIGIRALTY